MHNLSGFLEDEGGAAAIEFAIVSLPFFLFIFAILEIAMMFFAGTALDTSVKSVAREIRVGRAQAAGLSSDKMKAEICDGLLNLFDCSDLLKLEVYTVGSMADAGKAAPAQGKGQSSAIGSAGDYVVVRASLPWKSVTSLIASGERQSLADQYLLSSATVFRNEPFHD